MNPQRPIALILAGILVASVALLLPGCSSERSRNELSSPAPSSDEQFYRVLEPAGDVAPQARSARAVEVLEEIGTKVEFFQGQKGGVIHLGRLTLTVPPGALRGPQNIRMDVLGNGYVETNLFPEGLTFETPALLEMNLRGTDFDGGDATIYWYDPAAGAWIDLHGTYDPKTHKVSAEIPHFSSYRSGRAGW